MVLAGPVSWHICQKILLQHKYCIEKKHIIEYNSNNRKEKVSWNVRGPFLF